MKHSKWSPYIVSLMRTVVAFLFMTHGSQKLFGVPSHAPMQTVETFSQLGAAGILELFGGVLLLIGLFTRTVAFVLSGEMAVAYFQVHALQNPWPILNGGELAALYCFVFLYFASAGGGIVSIDEILYRRRNR